MELHFDDRTLAHLHLVIGAKLRRHESFMFNWVNADEHGDGRSSIWLDSGVPLYFKFASNANQTINREWLEALTRTSNSAQGLTLVPEPSPAAH